MNGIQCKEELDLEKNINNLPKMVKKVKAKYQKVKGYVKRFQRKHILVRKIYYY